MGTGKLAPFSRGGQKPTLAETDNRAVGAGIANRAPLCVVVFNAIIVMIVTDLGLPIGTSSMSRTSSMSSMSSTMIAIMMIAITARAQTTNRRTPVVVSLGTTGESAKFRKNPT